MRTEERDGKNSPLRQDRPIIPHSSPTIGQEEIEAVERVLRSGRLAQGPEVEAFEFECAEFFGRPHAVAVSSGTAALHLALLAGGAGAGAGAGFGAGTAVAVPAYACAALATAVQLAGGKALLCDVGPDYNLALDTMPEQCRASIVPHLFGAVARLPERGLVIEDIAQSLGGTTGKASAIAVASFYATKLMTTGEGGMVLTGDESIAAAVRDCRDYDNRDDLARRFNYKMTDFQAALGRVQLRRLPGFIERRRETAGRYMEAFGPLPLGLPNPDGHVFFRYVVATESRDGLERHLNGEGIEAKRPVYRPAHHYLPQAEAEDKAEVESEDVVKALDHYPGADAAHRTGLSLPIHPSMVEEDIDHVIRSVRIFFE